MRDREKEEQFIKEMTDRSSNLFNLIIIFVIFVALVLLILNF